MLTPPIMSALHARNVVKFFATLNNLSFAGLSAKTTRFTDLARGQAVYVTVKGIQPEQDWTPVKTVLKGTNVRLNLPLILAPRLGI